MLSRNLSHRILTGLPLAAAACWYIFGANKPAFVAITILIGFIACFEIGKAFQQRPLPFRFSILYITQISLFLSFWFLIRHRPGLAAGAIGFLLISLIAGSAGRKEREHRMVFWYLFVLIWIAFPLCLLYLLRFELVADKGSELIFFIILVAAFNDIFAYFGGKRFGKHPLAKVISPKKTIEGSLFGIGGGLIAGLGMSTLFLSDILPLWKAIPTIIVMVMMAQAGDLVESKFKRYCGIKDSSNLIPGHGGLLDRIDAYLLALPAFIGLIYIFNVV